MNVNESLLYFLVPVALFLGIGSALTAWIGDRKGYNYFAFLFTGIFTGIAGYFALSLFGAGVLGFLCSFVGVPVAIIMPAKRKQLGKNLELESRVIDMRPEKTADDSTSHPEYRTCHNCEMRVPWDSSHCEYCGSLLKIIYAFEDPHAFEDTRAS